MNARETGAQFAALARAAAETPAPPGLAALRAASREAFLASGLPGAKHEAWRYTRLTPLDALWKEHGARAPSAARSDGEAATAPQGVTRAELEALATPVFACGLLAFVNGRPAPELSGLPTGDVQVLPLESAGSPLLGALVDPKQHPFAALNGALAEAGVLLRIPEGATLDHPLHLVFINAASSAPFANPRVVVEAGAKSRALVMLDHVSLPAGRSEAGAPPQLCNLVAEVQVGEDAALDLAVLQRERASDFHFSNLAARLERGARFHSHVITLGGRLVRNDLTVTLAGARAECQMNGLFLGVDERLVDNHTLVDHALPHGRSRQLYKGVLAGRSRGVFRGRVLVRPDAQRTDAGQSNPNLLLSERAEVNTKPQLEIHADDVQCRHGATIGRMDEDALFYLRSRGLALAHARALLMRAFASEVLGALPGAALADALREEFSARLGAGFAVRDASESAP